MLGRYLFLSFLLFLACLDFSNSGAVQLDPKNIDEVLEKHEFVFLNFYADWCRFSNMLSPIWDEGADKINAELKEESVFVGKIDCDSHASLGNSETRKGLKSFVDHRII